MVRETSYYVIATILANIIQFISLPFFTSYLTPADYGVIALSAMVASIFSGLASIGLQQATFRFFFKKELSSEFSSINLTNIVALIAQFIVFAAIVWFYSDFIANFILSNNITSYVVGISLLLGATQYIYNYLIYLIVAQKQAIRFAVISVSLSVLNISISVWLILSYDMTYLSRIYGVIGANITLVGIIVYMTRNLFFGQFRSKYLLKSLKYSFPTVPATLISVGFQSFDKTMLSAYKDLSSVGYYDISNRFATVFKTLSDAINKSWQPYFLELSDVENSEQIVKNFYSILCVTMVAALSVIYFSEEAIRLLTNESYYFAMYVVPIIVTSYLIGDMTASIYVNQIIHKEKLMKQVPLSLFGLSINVIMNMILIPRYGVIGATIATLITVIVQSIYGLYIGSAIYKLSFSKVIITKLVLIFVSFTAMGYFLISYEINIVLKIMIKISLLAMFSLILISIINMKLSKIVLYIKGSFVNAAR